MRSARRVGSESTAHVRSGQRCRCSARHCHLRRLPLYTLQVIVTRRPLVADSDKFYRGKREGPGTEFPQPGPQTQRNTQTTHEQTPFLAAVILTLTR